MTSVDMKVFGKDESGVYYTESERIIIFLNNHESIEDFYKTIQHELIHSAIEKCGESMDEDQEENLIFNIQWIDFIL